MMIGQLEAVTELLKRGADANAAKSTTGGSALMVLILVFFSSFHSHSSSFLFSFLFFFFSLSANDWTSLVGEP
jgi:hypothetical protein